MVYRLLVLVAALFVIISCQTPPQPEVEEEAIAAVPEAEPVPESEPEPEPEPVEESTVPIEVPEDVYNRAFNEVSEVIEELNEIIARGDFEAWQEYLTPAYIEYHGNRDVLADLSTQPMLAQNDVRLRSLRDYFQYVVRPSRAGARLDSLVFYSDNLVEAVTVFRGQGVILYVLRKVGDEWKIDTFDEPPE